MTRGASRHQHDTLDQIIAKAIHFLPALSTWREEDVRELAAAVRDALLAEGRVFYCPDCDDHYRDDDSPVHAKCEGVEAYLWLALLVGVGCGNTTNKKDKP